MDRERVSVQTWLNSVFKLLVRLSPSPETPDASWLARVTPWWSVLHFLMQATTVLLLGFSRASGLHTPMSGLLSEDDLGVAINETRKAFFWIHAMAASDHASRRAFFSY